MNLSLRTAARVIAAMAALIGVAARSTSCPPAVTSTASTSAVSGAPIAGSSAGSATSSTAGSINATSSTTSAQREVNPAADIPPNAVTGKVTTAAFERYVFSKAGTKVGMTVGAPVGGDNIDPWRTVTDSFSWSA